MFFKTFIYIVISLTIIIPLLICVAFFTLAERKVMAAMQRRRGPNVVGFGGLLQPFADGLKLITKEIVIPTKANTFLFVFAPFISMYLSLLSWPLIPFSSFHYMDFSFILADYQLSYGLLYVFAVSSLGIYGVILAGWASNSKYPLIGSIRSAAQMISYEIAIGFVFTIVIFCSSSFNLTFIVDSQKNNWYLLLLFPIFIIFLISMLAETNRAPFDLPEAEAELVAGFNLEYSGILFALFFLGEYSNMLLMAALAVVMFLGGWYLPFGLVFLPELVFSIKLSFIAFFYIWVRATFPRYRYDQLMNLGWKCFLPVTLGFLLFYVGILMALDSVRNTAWFTDTNYEYYLTNNVLNSKHF